MLRCAAIAPAMPVPCAVRRVVVSGIEVGHDRARQIRMRGIDARVDHADQHTIAGGQPMGLGQAELLGRILVAVHQAGRGSRHVLR